MSHETGKLIIIPTPLGNLGDVTTRTLQAFEACDTMCCEDTRVTGKLLAALGIEKRLERLDEATVSKRACEIVGRVLDGEVIGFASDAGMPGAVSYTHLDVYKRQLLKIVTFVARVVSGIG